MTSDDLVALTELETGASAAPWHVAFGTDGACMSSCLIVKNPTRGRIFEPLDNEWPSDDVVAACLWQNPDIVGPDDRRSDANARLMAMVRNHLPELLRLARIGLAHESEKSD
ncbi:hypothetical protein [Sphingomonas jinjuensis]|uniref:hypothetical protein n=1 Tax=Sphingomonas jinjuensis TaxID=535907 RepID=UPI001C84748B|nr:hypothetical protein [Sphingomonas jinjuensis]